MNVTIISNFTRPVIMSNAILFGNEIELEHQSEGPGTVPGSALRYVGVCADVDGLLAEFRLKDPDVLVLVKDLEKFDELQCLRALKNQKPALNIVKIVQDGR